PWACRELVTQPQLVDQGAVALEIAAPEVGQEPSPGADHLEKAAPAVVVLWMETEMLGERVDPLGKQSHLDLRGSGVGLMRPMLRDHRFFLETHAFLVLVLSRIGATALSAPLGARKRLNVPSIVR